LGVNLGLLLSLWVLISLACSLTDPTGSNNQTEQFVDTTDWVAYGGERNVFVAAPAGTWRGITFDLPEAYEQGVALAETDPTVSNIYNFLVLEYVSKPDAQLVILRNDGTAWVVVMQETLNGTDFQGRITAIQQNQRAQNRNPINETTVNLAIGEATRWEIAYSPQGSQIVNRQWHYALEHEGVMIRMIFDAQSADFDEYRPIFHTIADTLTFADE
jgi:hypothetical protein